MKAPTNSKRKKKNIAIALMLRFLVRHGEKMIAGMLVLVAIGIALKTRNYTALPWKPDELVDLADNTETAIKEGTFSVVGGEVNIFNYAGHAVQIREQIPSEPYRNDAEWKPVIHPPPLPRGGFEVLSAESLRAVAVRISSVNAQTAGTSQWQRPPLPGISPATKEAPIWVNVYGTIPLNVQWNIINQTFDNAPEANIPKYVYYELERAEIKPLGEPEWQPVIVYSDHPELQTDLRADSFPDFSLDRLVPFEKQETLQEQQAENLLLFSDMDIRHARTYAYRMRLYLVNPNYNLQESAVEEGVDTKNEFVRSDWSAFAVVYVPDRTSVQIRSVSPPDPAEFPRQIVPLGTVRGTLLLDYFDMEMGQLLPRVEKAGVPRGALCNMSKSDANKYVNRGKTGDEIVTYNYPDSGLRSDVCIMDFSGGRTLQRKMSRESQGTPDLAVAGKALLLMPDGTMLITSTERELFR